jgi:hypothetical protein
VSTTTSFYIWISKGAHDVFALVVIFWGDWVPKHIKIGLFEAFETSSQALVRICKIF